MQQSKNQILEAGAKFLQLPDQMKKLSSQVQEDIRTGKKEFVLAEFYIRKKFSGLAGIIQVIKDTDVKTACVTNLDKGRLPEDIFMACVGVGLGYGYHATSVEVTAPRYSNSEYLNTIPTRLVNSEFRLKNGDRTILATRTKKFFANALGEYGVEANEENLVILPQPKLLNPKKIMNAEFEFANDAVAVPANNHFIEIVVYGVMIADRVES